MNAKSAIRKSIAMLAAIVASNLLFALSTLAADIKGQVLIGNAPIAKSTVTLWAASADAPKQIAQTKTSDDGRFEVRTKGANTDSILYLVATGGVAEGQQSGRRQCRPSPSWPCWEAIRRTSVVVNELTTVASAFTDARFINGEVDFRQSARTEDRRRKRSQPGRSRDRRMGQGAA